MEQLRDYKILIVDDEEILLSNFKEYLSDYNLQTFSDPEIAFNHVKENFYDIIICDFKMPKMNGFEFLMEAKKINTYDYAILLTAFADKNLLENMINNNVINKVIEKPVIMQELIKIIEEAISFCKEKKEKENQIEIIKHNYKNLKEELKFNPKDIVGLTKGLRTVYEQIKSIANVPATVLLTGETGTGKELIAKAIHEMSPRRDFPFIKVNITAIPDTLFESELFGYKKGAFSNAYADKPGKIELANKGTLFLDEIGDMELSLQSKLLRVIQEKEVERLGSNNPIKVDFRLIVATNRNLEELIKANKFREDLFYRLNEFPIYLPSLRERREDIEDLINYFIKKFSDELNIKNVNIDKEAIERLKNYSWPGNVRELENAIKRVLISYGKEGKILASHFHFIFPDLAVKKNFSLDNAIEIITENIINQKIDLDSLEELVIKSLLKHFNDSVSEAVEKTGISKNRFYKFK